MGIIATTLCLLMSCGFARNAIKTGIQSTVRLQTDNNKPGQVPGAFNTDRNIGMSELKRWTKGALRVFSGNCCLCDVGIPVNAKSTWGDPVEVHTGDIIIVWHGDYIGTDIETWYPTGGLSVVVSNDYQSFSDGSVELIEGTHEPYPMGIKGCGFDHPEWRIQVVKKHSDVISVEHWPDFGFSYKHSDAADNAIRKALGKESAK